MELLRNRLVKAAEVTEPRRCERDMSLEEVPLPLPLPLPLLLGALLLLSEDMMARRKERT